MKRYLVTYEDNWADEMDISGFFTCSKKYKKMVEKKLSTYDEEYTYCIGSNEDIEYENGLAILETLTFQKISEKEFKVLSRVFNYEHETDEEIVEEYIYEELDKKYYHSENVEIKDWEKLSEKVDSEFKSRMGNMTDEEFKEILEKSKDDDFGDVEFGFNPLEYILEELEMEED